MCARLRKATGGVTPVQGFARRPPPRLASEALAQTKACFERYLRPPSLDILPRLKGRGILGCVLRRARVVASDEVLRSTLHTGSMPSGRRTTVPLLAAISPVSPRVSPTGRTHTETHICV
jgi:hypothetical protein